MDKERKKVLDKLVKLVKKDGEYIVTSNSFTLEDINYFASFGIKTSNVNLVRKGLLGDYEVEYIGTRFERIED